MLITISHKAVLVYEQFCKNRSYTLYSEFFREEF